MRILSVELENIKSYARARIEFTDGVNAIVGRNGAGKSTILEAVGFALFSSLDYPVATFMREGAKNGAVIVTFESEVDARTYQSVRRITGGGVKQTIHDADLGVNLAEGDADVSRFLRMHLGLQPGADLARIFRDAVGVPQGTLTAAFQLTPSQRKAVFNPLLEVDEYKKGFDNLLDVKNLLHDRGLEVSNTIANLEGRLAALPDMERSAERNAAELKANTAALAAAQAELARVQASVAALEEQHNALAAAEKVRDSARSAYATAQAAAQLAQLQLEEAQAARALVEKNRPGHDCYLEAQRAKQRLDQETQARNQAQLERSAAHSALALAEQQLGHARDELAHIVAAEAQMEALQVDVAQQTALEARRAEAQARQGAFRGAEDALTQAEASLQQEQAKLVTLQAGLAKAPAVEQELARIARALQALDVRIGAGDEARNQKNAEGIAYNNQSEKLAQIQGAICPVCEAPLTPEHRAELMDRNARQMEDLRVELRELIAGSKALLAEREALEASRRAQEKALHTLPSAAAVAEQAAHVAKTRTQWEVAHTRREELAGAPEALHAIEEALRQLGSPAAQMAIARATALKRAATEAAQARAAAAAAAAEAQRGVLEVRLASFAGLDQEIERALRDQQDNLGAYQDVLAHQHAAALVEARTAAQADAAGAGTRLGAALAAAEAEATAAASAFDAAAYARLKTESARLHGEVGSLSSMGAMLAQTGAELERQIAALRTEQAHLAKARARRDALRHQNDVLTRLRDAVGKAGPLVTAHMIHKVSVAAAQIYGELTGDFAPVLNWGEDYAISLAVDGRKREYKSLAGGEQMVAALAVRLALLKTITGISVAFFDEPTANLDGQRREALAGQILSFKGLRQLFVISHDDTFEHATDNIIHLARVDGVSCVLDKQLV